MRKPLSISNKAELLCLTLTVSALAHGQDGTWVQDSSGPWEDTGAWSGGIVADGSNNTAFFTHDITDDVIVIMNSDRTIGHLQFSDTGTTTPGHWSILDISPEGYTLKLETTLGVPTITVGAMGGGRVVNIDAAIGGTQGLTKLGNGILRFNRANSYTGLTTVNAGTLVLGSANGNSVNGNLVLEGSSRVELGHANQIADNAAIIFAAGSAGRFRLQGFDETVAGIQSNGGSGTRIVEAAADNTSNASATLTLNVEAGETYNFDGYVRDAYQGTNSALSITKEGEGTQIFSGGNSFVSYSGTTTINGGVLEFTNGTFANNSVIHLGANGTVRFSNPANGNRNGIITGEGNLEHNGPQLLGLTGANTYTGLTIITQGAIYLNANAGNTINGDVLFNGGNLRLGQAHQIADTSVLRFRNGVSGRFTMHGLNETIGGLHSNGGEGVRIVESALDNVNNSPATLGLNTAAGETYTFDGFVRDAYNGTNSALSIVKSGEGTQVLSGGNSRVSYTGDTIVNEGVLELAGSTTLANSNVTLGTAGTIRFNNNVNVERARVIAGAGGVEVVGSGRVVFSSDNTYTGRTLVQDSELVINGDQSAATGDMIVGAGGTLAGTGIIGGITTIGGALNPGDGSGTLTFNKDLTLESTSTVTFEIESLSNFDVLANDGSAVILFQDGATVIFDFAGYTANLNDTFLLLENWSDRIVSGNVSFRINNLDHGYSLDTSDFFTTGSVMIVPEPTTVGMLMALAVVTAVGARRGMRRKRTATR